MMSRLVVVSALLFPFSTGCISALSSAIEYSEVPVNAATSPLVPRQPADEPLFTSGAPARSHVDVAVLWASSLVDHSLGELFDRLRLEGAKKGCDAVVVTDLQITSYDRSANGRIAAGTCIEYTGSGAGADRERSAYN